MSTGSTVSAALFLSFAVGKASSNAIAVLTPRVDRYPEVPCALSLIPPLFQWDDNVTAAYPPRLFVLGRADWLDEFLRQFPSLALIYVFSTTREIRFEDFFLVEMIPSASIVLRLVDNSAPAWIPFPHRMRFIKWMSFDSDAEADDTITDLSVEETCHRFFRVMVTARSRGTTHVFAVPMPCKMAIEPLQAKGELLGVWSPGDGWSVPHEPLFPPHCVSWVPPPNGEPLLVEMYLYGDSESPSLDKYIKSEAFQVLWYLEDSYGLVFHIKFALAFELMMPFSRADTCRLDALAFPSISNGVDWMMHTELSIFPWRTSRLLCIVPVGAGKPRSMLYPITAEYSPEVWAALAAVVLTVVACLYLMRRDESVQKLVLETLSPLLGQPMDDSRPGPQIAVLGGWLLTCVVVVGAYLGQLLGFITVPSQNGEINSWQEWLESDLVLLASEDFSIKRLPDFGLTGLTEDRVVRIRFSPRSIIEIIATERNASFFIFDNEYKDTVLDTNHSEQMEEWLRNVRTFELPMLQILKSSFVTTKGSPFEVPLRKILGRIRAAGGFRKNWSHNQFPLLQQTENTPISLINLLPVFAVYIVGNLIAVFTFLLELFVNLKTFVKFICSENFKLTTCVNGDEQRQIETTRSGAGWVRKMRWGGWGRIRTDRDRETLRKWYP
ncbi:Ionotropic receptor 258 [Frankliniella occidentalis]|nr:Ionotropic receptor 258 [Frankliniella occidentalis]